MKKFILSFFGFSCIFTMALSQGLGYHSIFEHQAQWDLQVLDYGNGRVIPVSHFVRKDTTVFGQQLMILSAGTNPGILDEVLIREDAANGKVYVLDNGKSQLLYDFSLKQNDKFSFDELDFEVVSVNEVAVLNSKRKVVELSCKTKVADNLIWIEGVGSTTSPLYYLDYGSSDRYVKVACFFKGSHLEYSLSDQPCARQLGSADQKYADLAVTMTPNPFNDYFRIKISNPSGSDVNIRVYDISGKQIYQELQSAPGQDFEKSVYLSDIREGIYFLNVSTEHEEFTRKIVKF